jgi:hypothetical protein
MKPWRQCFGIIPEAQVLARTVILLPGKLHGPRGISNELTTLSSTHGDAATWQNGTPDLLLQAGVILDAVQSSSVICFGNGNVVSFDEMALTLQSLSEHCQGLVLVLENHSMSKLVDLESRFKIILTRFADSASSWSINRNLMIVLVASYDGSDEIAKLTSLIQREVLGIDESQIVRVSGLDSESSTFDLPQARIGVCLPDAPIVHLKHVLDGITSRHATSLVEQSVCVVHISTNTMTDISLPTNKLLSPAELGIMLYEALLIENVQTRDTMLRFLLSCDELVAIQCLQALSTLTEAKLTRVKFALSRSRLLTLLNHNPNVTVLQQLIDEYLLGVGMCDSSSSMVKSTEMTFDSPEPIKSEAQVVFRVEGHSMEGSVYVAQFLFSTSSVMQCTAADSCAISANIAVQSRLSSTGAAESLTSALYSMGSISSEDTQSQQHEIMQPSFSDAFVLALCSDMKYDWWKPGCATRIADVKLDTTTTSTLVAAKQISEWEVTDLQALLCAIGVLVGKLSDWTSIIAKVTGMPTDSVVTLLQCQDCDIVSTLLEPFGFTFSDIVLIHAHLQGIQTQTIPSTEQSTVLMINAQNSFQSECEAHPTKCAGGGSCRCSSCSG